MNSIFPKLIFLLGFGLLVQAAADDNDLAKAECGNEHHLDFHNLAHASALYSNNRCMLKCTVGGVDLSTNALNEGFACPTNANGICHNGQCVIKPGSHAHPSDPLAECGNLLHIDFHSVNSSGTLYSDSQCFIKCMLNGAVATTSALNEGFACPGNHAGICQHGRCVVEPATSPTGLVHKLSELDVHIVGFNSTTGLEYKDPFGSVCIGDVANLTHVGKQSIDCKHHCATRVLDQTIKESVHWNTRCRFESSRVPFHLQDSFLVQVEFDGNKLAGAHVESLPALLERHYKEGHFKNGTVPFSFKKTENVEVKHLGKHVGVVEIELEYILNHK